MQQFGKRGLDQPHDRTKGKKVLTWLGQLLDRDRPEWEHHVPWGPVTLIDGSAFTGGALMRRKVGGTWQYRQKTDEEAWERLKDQVW